MRLKARRRIVLAALVLAVLAGGLFAAIFVRKWQRDAITTRYLEQATAAHNAGDVYTALGTAGHFIKRSDKKDPRRADALLIYADARSEIEEVDYRHLRDAANFYLQYLDRRDDPAIRQKVIELYNKSGHFVEARDLAAQMLPADLSRAGKEHLAILRELALALLQTKDFDTERTAPGKVPTLEAVLARTFELAPLDLQARIIQIDYLSRTQRKAEIRTMADGIIKDHPDDPAACIIAAVSRQVDPTPDRLKESNEFLCKAAGLDISSAILRIKPGSYTEPEIGRQLVSLFDNIRAFDHSLAVLQDGADRLNDPEMLRRLIRRQWQEGDLEAVAKRLERIDCTSRKVDADLGGLLAISLIRLGRVDEAMKIADILAQRQGDYRATAWAKAIPLVDPDNKARPADTIATLEEVVKATGSREPVFLVFLGEAHAALGQNEQARKAWADAAASFTAASWSLPWVRRAESFMAEGRVDDAAAAASAAMMITPTGVVVNIVWFEAHAARIQKGSLESPKANEVLARLKDAEANLLAMEPRPKEIELLLERLLPTKVGLMVRNGETDQAKAAIQDAITTAKQAATLQQLAAVSARERLGFEAECIARAVAIGGSSIDIAFTHAMELHRQGKTREGLTVLKSAAAANPNDPSVAIALAQFTERTSEPGDPAAVKAWADLGAKYETELVVQRAILGSPAAARDRALIDKSIERYAAILGGNGAGADDSLARLARARSLLSGPFTRADRDRAIALLGSVIAAQPGIIEPRLMLASALSITDPAREIAADLPRAAAELTKALSLEPRSILIMLDLARIHQAQGEYTRARDLLTRVASDAGVEAFFRRTAAELLISQGDTAPVALGTLEALVNQEGDAAAPSLLILLAEAYITQRQDKPAAEIYDRLAARMTDPAGAADPDTIFMTARHLQGRGEVARADQVLARLDTLNAGPGIKEFVLARLAARREKPEEAVVHYEAAVTAAPGRADIWREYAALQLRRGEFKPAAEVAERGLAKIPGDHGLTTVLGQAKLFGAEGSDKELGTLIRSLALSGDSAAGQIGEVSRIVREAKSRGDLNSAAGLVQLADRFPTSGQVQLFVGRLLVPLDPEAAATMAARARSASPADASVAQSAAEIYLALGRYRDVLSTARVWRDLDVTGSAEPAIAMAEAHYRLKEFDQGLKVLEPRVDAAKAKLDDPMSLGVLNIYSRLLVGAGHAEKARTLLAPMLSSSRNVRVVIWLSIATSEVSPVEKAKDWIKEGREFAPADAIPERLAWATACAVLASRFPDQAEALRAESLKELDAMAADPTATAEVLESLGKLRHITGNLPAAEDAYRKAVGMDPARADSLNNLANLALQVRKDADEAIGWAQRAVAAQPSPDSLDTLALCYVFRGDARERAKDRAGADSDYKAAADTYLRIATLRPADPRPLRRAAFTLDRARNPAAAVIHYEALLRMPGQQAKELASAKNNLAMCLLRLGRGGPDLERAASLMQEAVRDADEPAFLDTQGWVELAANRRDSAAAVFRAALQRAPANGPVWVSSSIGLATALAGGDAAQRGEAAGVLAAIGPEAAAALDDEEAAKLTRARELVGR